MASADVYQQRLCHFFPRRVEPSDIRVLLDHLSERKTAYGDQR
jgi:hypothetical protein